MPIRQPVCPLVDSSLTTICLASCTTDSDCTGDQICCTSSCNRACKDPVFIPYYAIPPVCPVPTVEDFFSICRIDEESCTANSQCEDTELCCDDGRCGRTCTEAINSRFPCFEVLERIRSGFTLEGALHVWDGWKGGRILKIGFTSQTCVPVQVAHRATLLNSKHTFLG